MYNYSNNLLPPAINYFYISNNDVHKYSTRQKHLLYINKSNINVYAESVGNTSFRVWNALQSKIDVNVPITKFRKSSKNDLQDNSLVLKYTKQVLVADIYMAPQLNCYIISNKNHFLLFVHYTCMCVYHYALYCNSTQFHVELGNMLEWLISRTLPIIYCLYSIQSTIQNGGHSVFFSL